MKATGSRWASKQDFQCSFNAEKSEAAARKYCEGFTARFRFYDVIEDNILEQIQIGATTGLNDQFGRGKRATMSDVGMIADIA